MTYTLDDLPGGTRTPVDYTRLHFDPSQVPAKRIVGLLACQRDPLLRTLKTKIVTVTKGSAIPVQKGREKEKKKKSSAPVVADSAPASGSLWEVELEDTVIFPEGGGQPPDTGLIHVLDPNGGKQSFAVESCIRRKLDSVHFVRVPEGGPALDELDLVGTEIEVEVNWDRRIDHMALHTGQHLLSAILDTLDLPTLSWGMAPHPSLEAPYVELPRGLTWAEAEAVEKRCNDLIAEDRKVWVDVSVQGGEEGLGGASEADRESRGIPKDYSGGVIRHINIDGIDRNACCGTQVPSLSLIGQIHVVPPSTPSTATKPASLTPTRLFFLAGPRAMKYLLTASRQLSLTAQSVGTGRADVVERVAKVDSLRAEYADQAKLLRAELSTVVADTLVSAATTAEGSTPLKVVWLHRTERATHDFEFLGTVASIFTASNKTTAVVLTSAVPPPSGNASGAQTGQTPALVLVSCLDPELAKKVYEQVKGALEDAGGKGRVKGGGAKGRFMAKSEGKWTSTDTEKIKAVVDEVNQ